MHREGDGFGFAGCVGRARRLVRRANLVDAARAERHRIRRHRAVLRAEPNSDAVAVLRGGSDADIRVGLAIGEDLLRLRRVAQRRRQVRRRRRWRGARRARRRGRAVARRRSVDDNVVVVDVVVHVHDVDAQHHHALRVRDRSLVAVTSNRRHSLGHADAVLDHHPLRDGEKRRTVDVDADRLIRRQLRLAHHRLDDLLDLHEDDDLDDRLPRVGAGGLTDQVSHDRDGLVAAGRIHPDVLLAVLRRQGDQDRPPLGEVLLPRREDAAGVAAVIRDRGRSRETSDDHTLLEPLRERPVARRVAG